MNAPLRAGQAHPVATLFGEHGTFVFRTLRSFGVRDDATDDALQDVFATAYRRWSSFEGRAAPRSWLYGISRRVAFRYRRSAKTRGERVVFAEVDRAVRPFDRAEARATVVALLDGLDNAKRDAFVLVELEGLTAPEAATALAVPVGTVYSRVRAAWALLRRAGAVDEALVRELPRPQMSEPRQQAAHRAVAVVCGPWAAAASAPVAAISGWAIAASVAGLLLVGGGAWVLTRPPARPAIAAGAADGPPPSSGVVTPDAGASISAYSGTPERPRAADVPVRDPAERRDPPTGAARDAALENPASAERAPARSALKGRNAPDAHASQGERASTEDVSPPREADDTLAAEVELLRTSQRARARGDWAAAKAALTEHARRFPHGQLADERDEALETLQAR